MQKLTFTNIRGQSIELNSIPPYILTKVEGLGDVSAENQTQKAPFQDGTTYINTMLGERFIALEVSITQTGATISEARKTFASIFNPKLGPGSLQYVHGSVVKEIEAIPEHVPVFPSGSKNRSIDFQTALISLKCPNPFWQSINIETTEMAYVRGGFKLPFHLPVRFATRGYRRKVVNQGDVPTPVTLKFYGPADNPVITNVTTGKFIKVNRSLLENDELEISTELGNKYARINGVNAFNYIDLESEFWQLEQGENILSFTSNNDSTLTKVVVNWKNRHVGV